MRHVRAALLVFTWTLTNKCQKPHATAGISTAVLSVARGYTKHSHIRRDSGLRYMAQTGDHKHYLVNVDWDSWARDIRDNQF